MKVTFACPSCEQPAVVPVNQASDWHCPGCDHRLHFEAADKTLPTCAVCADSMVAAEASAYLSDNVISYLWTCDTCGYGFVTKHALKRFACN